MKNSPAILLIFILICLFLGCKSESPPREIPSEKIVLSYAEGFSLARGNGFWVIEVTQPWTGADRTFRYLVLEENQEAPAGTFDAQIQLPSQKVILTSTTQIPHLDLLGLTEKLVGFPQTDLISSVKTRALIATGKVTELGSGPAANPELVVDLAPDWIMISTLGDDLRYLELLQTSGIPAVINGEYVEQHPLGRAEWIKLTGVLFGKYEEAKTIFEKIEQDYLEAELVAKEIAAQAKPSVLSGVMYQDSWYAPGSESWGAQILENAGGKYIFEDQSGTGSLQLNYEFVVAHALESEFWIGSADFESLEKMGEIEPRYRAIRAFQNGKVFTYTQKKGQTGGLEYFELGYMRPDLILKDLIKILHPNLLPDYELYFYKQLNEN